MLEAPVDEPKPQVTLEVVDATLSSPMFDHESLEPSMAPEILSEAPELPRITVSRRVELEIEVAIVVAVAVSASFFAADARVAIVAGSLGLSAVGFRRIDRRVPFSFGEGFVGYRADPGWPRGVQEDNDVHWNWTPGEAPDARDTARVMVAEP